LAWYLSQIDKGLNETACDFIAAEALQVIGMRNNRIILIVFISSKQHFSLEI